MLSADDGMEICALEQARKLWAGRQKWWPGFGGCSWWRGGRKRKN